MTTLTFTSPDGNEEVDIEFEFDGAYVPATLETPEEYPHLNIITPLPAWLTEEEVFAAVEEDFACDDYYEEDCYDEDPPDSYYDQW